MTSKFLVNNCYFVLYDFEDNIVCYFENYFELIKVIKIATFQLTRKINEAVDYVVLVINNIKYKLYTYCD